MSKISSIYDELLAWVPTILTDHTQLNNPYELEDDSDINMRKGWVLGFAEGENTNRVVGCKFSYTRIFNLVVTRRVFGTLRDASLRISTEKLLLEDQKLLINGAQQLSSDNFSKLDFIADNGLEFLGGDRLGILLIQNRLSVEYFEDLT